jgi:hypothetical protein
MLETCNKDLAIVQKYWLECLWEGQNDPSEGRQRVYHRLSGRRGMARVGWSVTWLASPFCLRTAELTLGDEWLGKLPPC